MVLAFEKAIDRYILVFWSVRLPSGRSEVHPSAALVPSAITSEEGRPHENAP
jgi:hypothetical protein